MAKKKFYIVWNPKKNEGFITDDEDDARFTADGISPRFGNPTVGEALRECYCEDDGDGLPMQEIELEV